MSWPCATSKESSSKGRSSTVAHVEYRVPVSLGPGNRPRGLDLRLLYVDAVHLAGLDALASPTDIRPRPAPEVEDALAGPQMREQMAGV